jgi:hypothetical protein
MKAEVDKYEESREFPWEIVLSQAVPFIVELFSRRRALKKRIEDLENLIKVQQYQITELKELIENKKRD